MSLNFPGAPLTSKEFRSKPVEVQRLINEALYMLHTFGVPLKGSSSRRLERMALAFLAVADVKRSADWPGAKDQSSGRSLKTRDIIAYVNTHFGENISPGSYDDIRRKDLALPVEAGIIVRTLPDAARNDSTRGYALSPEYADRVRAFSSSTWEQDTAQFMEGRETLATRLSSAREVLRVPVKVAVGRTLYFSPGEHNQLQKAIIEEFLPRYGHDAEVLYVGDAAKKSLLYEKEKLDALHFFELAHGELPDVVAYSEKKNWLYLIEAVHSSGPITPMRRAKLEELTKPCTASIIYVTAFLDRAIFRSWVRDIAWETEVWVADSPDHVIHFDGERFLGPYADK